MEGDGFDRSRPPNAGAMENSPRKENPWQVQDRKYEELQVEEILRERHLSPEDERILIARMVDPHLHKAAREAAQSELFKRSRRLVLSCAHKCKQGTDLMLSDLLSIGYVELATSLRRFDPSRGVRLGTFAHWRIMGAMLREARGRHHIRIPQHAREALQRYERQREDLTRQLCEPPSDGQLCAALGWSPKQLDDIRSIYEVSQSMEYLAGLEDWENVQPSLRELCEVDVEATLRWIDHLLPPAQADAIRAKYAGVELTGAQRTALCRARSTVRKHWSSIQDGAPPHESTRR